MVGGVPEEMLLLPSFEVLATFLGVRNSSSESEPCANSRLGLARSLKVSSGSVLRPLSCDEQNTA